MRKNPATYSQPDLFEEGDTPNFVPLEELDEGTLRRLPREAYSFDEWDELDDDIKVAVLIGDPTGENPKAGLKRLDFDEDDWDVLPDSIKEHIYETDVDSQARVEALKDGLQACTVDITDEQDMWSQWAEEELDYFFNDAHRLKSLYGDELLERLGEEYPNVDWEDEEDMVLSLAAEGPLTVSPNFDLNLVRGSMGEVSVGIRPFYATYEDLFDGFDRDEGDPQNERYITEDEIQRAIDEREEEDQNVFTYVNLEPSEVISLRDSGGGWRYEIDREYDTDFISVSVEPFWDEIINDLIAETEIQDLIEEAEDGPLLKEEAYTEEDFEDRILDRIELHDGTYSIIDLLPSELKKESKKMKHCVGQASMGYGEAIRRGRIRILSVRPSDTKEKIWERTFTLEVKLDPHDNTSNIKDLLKEGKLASIEQMKSTRNRIPGFAKPAYGQRATADDLVYPEEFNSMLKVAERLGFHYDEVRDLWPGGELMMKLEAGAKRNPPFSVQMPDSSFDKPYGSQ